MKIVFLDESTITLDGDMDFLSLRTLGSYQSFDNCTEQQVIERAKDADVVISNKVPITRNVLEKLNDLKLVSVIATGYNNVDEKAAKKHNVRVCNVAGYAANSVPQHTFAMILNLATKAYRYNSDIEAGKWEQATSFTLLTYPTFELAGKTIGIIGFGVIGRAVAGIAEVFGMKVLVHDIYLADDKAYSNTDLDSLLGQSDIVTLHCPLTDDNQKLINADTIAKMKDAALLINTSRGGLVDEKALADALGSGKLAGAGIDVLSAEPPENNNPLLHAKNIILTPHSAWSTREARQKLVDETALNIKAFFEGTPRNVVM